MPAAKITKAFVDAVEASAKDKYFWDTDLRGFGLKVTPAGKKVYVTRYRIPGVRQDKRGTIGPHGSPWTPQAARKEAQRILFAANEGVDHNAEKRRSREQSVELAFDAYAAFFADEYLRKHWKGSFDRAVSVLRCHAIPYFGKRPITKITKRDVALWLETLAEQKATARKAAEVVGKLFRWAEDRDDIDRSPMDRTPRPKANPSRERFLEDDELLGVWEASEAMNHPYGALIRMLALSGQRLGEVRGMQWSELNFEREEWVVPSGRSKSKRENVVPLTPLMLGVLESRPRIGPFVFTISGKNALGNLDRLKKRLDRQIASPDDGSEAAKLGHWTLHDLRRTVAVGLQRLNVEPHLVEVTQSRKIRLGAGETYQRYRYLPQKREALTGWDKYIQGLLSDR